MRDCLASFFLSLNFHHSSLNFSHPFGIITQFPSLNIFHTICGPYMSVGVTFSLVFFFSLDRSSVLVFFFLSFSEFGYWKQKKKQKKTKKKLNQLTHMSSQIVWKILSDGNWVMMPNGCEKLSDEWWKLSDQKNESKQPLSIILKIWIGFFVLLENHTNFFYFSI